MALHALDPICTGQIIKRRGVTQNFQRYLLVAQLEQVGPYGDDELLSGTNGLYGCLLSVLWSELLIYDPMRAGASIYCTPDPVIHRTVAYRHRK